MNDYWGASDVQAYLKVSKPKAYKIIREVNDWVRKTKKVNTYNARVYVNDLKAYLRRPLN